MGRGGTERGTEYGGGINQRGSSQYAIITNTIGNDNPSCARGVPRVSISGCINKGWHVYTMGAGGIYYNDTGT